MQAAVNAHTDRRLYTGYNISSASVELDWSDVQFQKSIFYNLQKEIIC